jgi:hypothetical protein
MRYASPESEAPLDPGRGVGSAAPAASERQFPLGSIFFILAVCSAAFMFFRNPALLSYHMLIAFVSACVVIQMLRRAWSAEDAAGPDERPEGAAAETPSD